MAPGSLITRPGQVQYGELLLGAGTPYRWRGITGWEELPALDSGTVPRSDAHGAFPGGLLAQARTIGLDGLVIRAPRASVGAVVGALNAGTVPVEDERPFVAAPEGQAGRTRWPRPPVRGSRREPLCSLTIQNGSTARHHPPRDPREPRGPAGPCETLRGPIPQPATASYRLHTPSTSITSAATLVMSFNGTRFISALPPTMPSPATAHSASTAPRPTESGSS